jgi:hypothetical protein
VAARVLWFDVMKVRRPVKPAFSFRDHTPAEMRPLFGAARVFAVLVALLSACSGAATPVGDPTAASSVIVADQPSASPALVPPSASPTMATAGPARSPSAGSSPSGAASTPPSSNAASAAPTTATGLPAFQHVYLIVMENREYGSIIGDPDAPYLNSLAAQYGLATNYDAVAHPSEPNYLALFSGSTQGVTDDGVYTLSGTNLADQLEAHEHSWSVFAENVPVNCFTGATATGGPDGEGNYARKHEPAISFEDIATDPARCSRITDFTHFDPAAADFELIVPNLCHDMHDCSVATGDAFLGDFVPTIINSPEFADSVLFITWDEGVTGTGGGGHAATLVVSPLVPAGTRSDVAHTHYSLLRTIENAWGLGCLAEACKANDLGEFFPG